MLTLCEAPVKVAPPPKVDVPVPTLKFVSLGIETFVKVSPIYKLTPLVWPSNALYPLKYILELAPPISKPLVLELLFIVNLSVDVS